MAMTRKEILQRYYQKNKEKIRERQKEYEAKPEVLARHNELQKIYYQKHKPELKVIIKQTDAEKKASRQNTIRKYYEKNKDIIAVKKNKWRLKNLDRYALYCAKRRSFKLGNGVFRITANDIKRMLHRQRHECFWCGEKMVDYEMDHVIPVSKGGRHSIGNIVLACKDCNRSKWDRLPIEFKIFNANIIHYKSIS